ncbi:phosphotransferase family protein [Catenulispora rubra]|uniref:phosphotransferase family protein n=1 Tax=Catenulispora rubra TaxID=280293 RepID=UPI00189240BC|nr:aminoglycoside phosphotransferase family protein [Catenulispora rubra]
MAELTREQAAEMMREAVPGARVLAVERMDGGIETGAYEIVCADPLQNAVVKVYGKDDGWKLLKEIGVYRLLRENAIELLPKLLGGAGPNGLLGLPYLLMGKLPGTTVAAITDTLPEPELKDVYRQMGALLAQIHTIGQEAYGYLTTEILDPQPTNQAQMQATLKRVSQSFLDTTGDRELYEAAHKYVSERAELFSLCRGPVLLHNDFHEGNVIVTQTPDGPVLSGLIDVENAMAGDPIADLSKTHSYSIGDNRTKLDGLFEGYGEVPVEWERRFRLFQLIHSFELWDFFCGIGAQDKLDPIAEEIRVLIAAG